MPDYKYYTKVETSPKHWRYFYSKAEYDAYLANKYPKKKEEPKKEDFLSNLISSGKTFFNNLANGVTKVTKDASNAITKTVSEVKNTVTKTVNKTSNFMNSIFNKTNTRIKSLIDEGKKAVERTFKYFAKVVEGKSTRYFYSKEEYMAYLNKGKEFVGKLFTGKTDDLINIGKTIANTILNGVGATALKKVIGISGLGMAKDFVSAYLKRHKTKLADVSMKKTINDDPKKEKDSDMRAVNQNFNPKWDDPSYSITTEQELQEYYDYAENCIACSVTYDLRQRGYDVKAAASTSYDRVLPGTSKNLLEMYDNPDEYIYDDGNKLDSVTDVWDVPPLSSIYERQTMCANIKDQCEDGGDGSRGVLLIQWSSPNTKAYMGGHAINYEVDNGTVYIRDCQRNLYQTMDEYLEDNSDFIGRLSAVRLDNSEPNDLVTNWAIDSKRKD